VPPRQTCRKHKNYVTQVGIDELLNEKQELINEENLEITDENERRIALNHINAKLQLLKNRILTAKNS
jgi:transcription elongation factor GreB